ncbi:lysosomal alpha-mannosidase-like protein [Dinothrombium tinctorium]|uniref:Alpha-mannosidase n=1 Tax=Dinothrombium tinctorium TaxID=1965070 RepID=A0A3S3PUW6_9ACAR|nr:lysosomal alpha-mannosidase-like protein [Dinothrombium tinctorium]RWS08573.1 lysosomal alpha-mannosidase-like protein [Dinothrombium tinctorium]
MTRTLSFAFVLPLFVFTSTVCFARSVKYAVKCDYEHCPAGKADHLNVHIVSHTHDDVGWLKTVDQYYYGAKTDLQRAGVQYILDSVIPELLANPQRRFIYVETAFFWQWWKEQNNVTKDIVVKLVNEGRLEFIGGGWCMNDEAAAHYNAIIDQMTFGHRKLLDTFGKCGVPKVAWQIDPFGHSREQAFLFAKMNFDGLFFGRLDWMDKVNRAQQKTLELVWKGSDESVLGGDLFTGALPNGYNPPNGFCFDDTCADEPIIDDPQSDDYNVARKVDDFINASVIQSEKYATNHIIMTMGSDFQYQNAHIWYKNLDKLIKYVNEQQENGSKVNVFYSSPSCYLYALNKAGLNWTTKRDDFLPYSSDRHSYWTGYFTSRPAQKRYIRDSNNILQITKQLQTLSRINDKRTKFEINSLKQAMAVNQHHDAVTGTEKQHVAYDYARQLSRGVKNAQSVIINAYKRLLPGLTASSFSFCLKLNESECSITETYKSFTVTIYNPLVHERSFTVRLPVVGKSAYNIFDHNGDEVESTLIPIPDYVKNIPGRKSHADFELVFEVSLPALGLTTYEVHKAQRQRKWQSNSRQDTNVIKLKAKSFIVTFDAKSGEMKGIQMNDGKFISAKQSFKWYQGMAGNNSKSVFRASGAYIFRPNGTHDFSEAKASFHLHKNGGGEIHQTYNSWLGQSIRVDPSKDLIEFDWVVGPIPFADGIGKEIITHFETDLQTQKVFYTDSNGRQILKRVRDHRDTWKYVVTEPVSGNYYPVNSRIFIRDEQRDIQLTVLNDRTQGGSSVTDGCLELMVHRRLLYDDAFGVGEPLNETGVDDRGLVVRGKHFLILSKIEDGAKMHRKLAQEIYMAPLITFSNYNHQERRKQYFNTKLISFLNTTLPENVHLLTLEQWENGRVLLRLEHYFESTEDPSRLSQPVKVYLKHLFTPFKITNAVEMTLSANQLLSSATRLKWKTKDDNGLISSEHSFEDHHGVNNELVITLYPMQIRTFIVDVADKQK